MKIVTLGEIMIRLQPYDHLRFVQTDTLQYTYGGGEANVAVSLANYGAGRCLRHQAARSRHRPGRRERSAPLRR